MQAEIIRLGIFQVQVCVPKDWEDKKIIDFVEKQNPSGTVSGWQIEEKDDKFVNCSDKENFKHCVLGV